LGVCEVKKWISLIALKAMGEDNPVELVIDSVMRAHFCEMLAPLFDMRNRSDDLFLMGMFSTIDTFMDRPMDEILTGLPIAYEIKEALLGKRNALYDVFTLCQSYKEGNWEEVDYYINKLHIADNLLQDLYNESLRWVDQVLLLN
jgi:c-di-GMP-related signal transduction protein